MMNEERQDGFHEQERMVQAWFGWLRQAEPSSRLIETHVSWIVISGRYAYKIKKALYLDFLDYSDLATRHFYCREEIRLNRRTAPEIYLDVIQIGGDRQAPRLRADPPLEYAVRMRSFENDRQLDRLLGRDGLEVSHIDGLADTVAGHTHAEFLDDADGFMADGETGFDGIFPFQDMDIGTADGGRRDSDQRLAGADFGNGFFIQNDLAGFDEYCRFHGTHRLISILVWNWAEKASFHPTGNTGVTGTGLPGSCLWPCRYRSLACR